jgi:hypothetical protein
MARRRTTPSLALPWERQGGSRVRELVSGGQWRWVVLGVAVLWLGSAVWDSAEERERVRRTREVISETRHALADFREDVGRCPNSIGELVHPPRASVRYLREEPRDGWGNPLWVRCPGRYDPEGVDVVSAGPSGNFLVDDNLQ